MIPSPLQRFKLLVAKLLDERNLATSKATKVTTFIIVGLILISAFQVVLDSIPGALRFSRLFSGCQPHVHDGIYIRTHPSSLDGGLAR